MLAISGKSAEAVVRARALQARPPASDDVEMVPVLAHSHILLFWVCHACSSRSVSSPFLWIARCLTVRPAEIKPADRSRVPHRGRVPIQSLGTVVFSRSIHSYGRGLLSWRPSSSSACKAPSRPSQPQGRARPARSGNHGHRHRQLRPSRRTARRSCDNEKVSWLSQLKKITCRKLCKSRQTPLAHVDP